MFNIFYSGYRNSLPLDDAPYLKNLLEEAIVTQYNLFSYFSELDSKQNNKILSQILKSSRTNYRLLQVIYSNLFGNELLLGIKLKRYEDKESVILVIIDLSEKLRKLLYGISSQTHKYMLFDLIISDLNNMLLLILYNA